MAYAIFCNNIDSKLRSAIEMSAYSYGMAESMVA